VTQLNENSPQQSLLQGAFSALPSFSESGSQGFMAIPSAQPASSLHPQPQEYQGQRLSRGRGILNKLHL